MKFRPVIIFLLTLAMCNFHCSRNRAHIFAFGDILGHQNLKLEKDSSVLFTGDMTMSLVPTTINPGKYTLIFKAHGDIAQNVLPILRIQAEGVFVKDLDVSQSTETYRVNIEIFEPRQYGFQFTFANDYYNPPEDRNLYLHFPMMLQPYWF